MIALAAINISINARGYPRQTTHQPVAKVRTAPFLRCGAALRIWFPIFSTSTTGSQAAPSPITASVVPVPVSALDLLVRGRFLR